MSTIKQQVVRQLGRAAIALAWTLLLAGIVPASASAQTFQSLYSFTGGNDGGLPEGPLIWDGKGNLYGTANSSANGEGNGTVYKFNQRGKLTVLYTFPGEGGNGANGAGPYGGLTRDAAGNFYGTTYSGGSHTCEFGPCGTVFKLEPSGKETVLHNVAGPPHDGANPFNITLLPGPPGTFYGATYFGGSGNCDPGNPGVCGTAFAVGSAGHETIIHNFQGQGKDGLTPWGNMVQDAQGNMYGTTSEGGEEGGPECVFAFGCGTLFKLSPNSDGSWTESELYSFTGGSDGELPMTLAIDAQGNLYGATAGGGSGWGTLYKLDTTGKFTVLYSFTGGSDGYGADDVVLDAAGNLYGTTPQGGASRDGVVFKLDTAGNFTVLHTFSGTDGKFAGAALSLDKTGTLYGTTQLGGTYGWGTIYKLTP